MTDHKEILSSENSERHINDYDIIYKKAMDSVRGIERNSAETLKRSQTEAKNALEKSHEHTAETLVQSHEKYFSFFLELQKKNQHIMDTFHNLTSTLTDNPMIKTISRDLHDTLESIKIKYSEFKIFEELEAKQLKAIQQVRAAELEALHKSEAQMLQVLQRIDSEKLRIIQESFTVTMKK